MPTFKNNGISPIVYEGIIQRPNNREQSVLVIVDGGKEMATDFWIPYEELGLELVDADNPKVKGSTLLSGTFSFDAGTERKFPIGHCDKYILDVLMQSGSVKIYHGSSDIGTEVSASAKLPYRYHKVNDWEFSPYIRVIGLEDNTTAVIQAEIYRSEVERE